MATDADLDHLDSRLNAFAVSNEEHHDSLQSLLQEYQKLLDSHRELRKRLEEQKAPKIEYKEPAKEEGNPFVLVLIDGDGYFFRDRFLRAGDEGGASAAQTLRDSINEILLPRLGKDADQCRVVVRVYANLAGLSQTMYRLGNVGSEARSLASVSAGFTRSQDLYEFIDAGDGKECASIKIRDITVSHSSDYSPVGPITETFRLFADNSQCKHIFFAGCHDAKYMHLVSPYRNTTDKVTLIKGPSVVPMFGTLGLPMEELPSVFRCTKIEENSPAVSTAKHSQASSNNVAVCKFFQKGFCKKGDECRKSHTLPQQTPSISSPLDETISDLLPNSTPQNERLIPVNKNGERIDTSLPRPSATSWSMYQRRSRLLKPCNKYHVTGECEAEDCPFDHGPIEQRSVDVMRYLMREYTCPRGSACRKLKCYSGHLCQRKNCPGGKPCKIRRALHGIDLKISHWEFPDDHDQEGGNMSDNASEDSSTRVSPGTF